MFDTSKYLKSKWLKGSDLQPGEMLTLTISRAFEQTFEQNNETKAVLEFSDYDQGLVLNKTRMQAMVNAFGPDPRLWINQRINLMSGPSGFKGEATIIIQPVRPVLPGAAGLRVPQRMPAAVEAAPPFQDREYSDSEAPAF